jgi:hypothetical protein
MKKQTVDLGEYKIVIEHDDSGNGHLIVTILDELEEPIEGIEISNDVAEDE